jgi:hypothetical protein
MKEVLIFTLPGTLMLAALLFNIWVREPWEARREQRRRQASSREQGEEKLAVKP